MLQKRHNHTRMATIATLTESPAGDEPRDEYGGEHGRHTAGVVRWAAGEFLEQEEQQPDHEERVQFTQHPASHLARRGSRLQRERGSVLC